ncbi:MAG: hypothetical protein AABX53_00240 [Nanoarchaeota archaeon]
MARSGYKADQLFRSEPRAPVSPPSRETSRDNVFIEGARALFGNPALQLEDTLFGRSTIIIGTPKSDYVITSRELHLQGMGYRVSAEAFHEFSRSLRLRPSDLIYDDDKGLAGFTIPRGAYGESC